MIFHRTPINYLLVNLAVADALYATFVTPQTFFKIIPTHPGGTIGTVLCKLVTGGYLAWTAGTSSVITLVAIAAERYFAVIYPVGNVGKLTKRKLKVIIPGSWIFALIFFILYITGSNVKDNACVRMDEEWLQKAETLLWSVIVVAAMVLMAGLYSRIVYTLWFKCDPENQLAFQQMGVLRVRKRVTLMGVTVTAIFGICWATDVIAHNLDYFTSVSVSELAYAVIHMLVLFSSAVNPFVYALVNKTFRQKLKGMICRQCTGSTGSTRIRVFPQKLTSTAGTSSLE
ncbi:pyroglutamylated RFamide peptide receptor-like [Orbicella faveolata]|uniref:pyroglutamylated RFamide peptide receptor-like n=1 Tax=Orbicella faveolata TaxID=48498 RepID=UPI0009E4FD6B|nr:pyroglutamylated RFamide peptide receptor-like [Orbicella faveolata]